MDDNYRIHYLTPAVFVDLDDGADGLEDWCEIWDMDSILPISGKQSKGVCMVGNSDAP